MYVCGGGQVLYVIKEQIVVLLRIYFLGVIRKLYFKCGYDKCFREFYLLVIARGFVNVRNFIGEICSLLISIMEYRYRF